jgi:hypothetical protein
MSNLDRTNGKKSDDQDEIISKGSDETTGIHIPEACHLHPGRREILTYHVCAVGSLMI